MDDQPFEIFELQNRRHS